MLSSKSVDLAYLLPYKTSSESFFKFEPGSFFIILSKCFIFASLEYLNS
jgi:hypothetical protein